MSYTTPTAVAAVLGRNYDGSTDLQQYIDSAEVVIARMIACAQAKGFSHTEPEVELIERWLAAHFYCKMDPLYNSNSTEGASGAYQRKGGGEGFESTDYGEMAVRLDDSGCLNAMGKRMSAGGFWLGKPVSDQVPYDQRS
jgi:hypothetical protein